MPVATKTSRLHKSKSKRKPTTIIVGARPKAAKKSRKSSSGAKNSKEATPVRARKRKSGKDHGALPSWRQLESKKNRRRKQDSGASPFQAVSTARFALLLASVAAAFTLYVGHIHATQDVLARTEQARKENHGLHMKYNRLKGDFDRMTGPAEVHRHAQALGFVEDAAFGKTIVVNP